MRITMVQLQINALEIVTKYHNGTATREDGTLLYRAVYDLAIANLNRYYYLRNHPDKKDIAHDFSASFWSKMTKNNKYLLREESELPFPLANYVFLNIRQFAKNRNDLSDGILEDMPATPDKLKNDYFGAIIIKNLKLVYTKAEINRLFPIAIQYIQEDPVSISQLIVNNGDPNVRMIPKDIHHFIISLVAFTKYATYDHSISDGFSFKANDLRKALKSSVNSTLFLSHVANSDVFPRPLLLSLDIHSLTRLIHVAGGQTIRIPTLKEFNLLIAQINVLSESFLSGKNPHLLLEEFRKDHTTSYLKLPNTSHHSYLNALLNSLKDIPPDNTTPFIKILSQSISSLEKILLKISDSNSEYRNLEQYTAFSESFQHLTQALKNIDQISTKH